jgi:hypothetical protein
MNTTERMTTMTTTLGFMCGLLLLLPLGVVEGAAEWGMMMLAGGSTLG